MRTATKTFSTASQQTSVLASGIGNQANKGLTVAAEQTAKLAGGVGSKLGKALGSLGRKN